MKNVQLTGIINGAIPSLDTSGLRELSPNEMTLVSGSRPEGFLNALINSGGLFSPTNIAKASRLVGGLGFIYGAYRVGYSIGTVAYNVGSNAYYGGKPGK